MVLLPKEFEIDAAKLDKRFVTITSANYDGLVKSGDNFIVTWKNPPNNSDLAAIEIYWRNLTLQVYNSPTAEEQTAYLAGLLNDARNFGNALIGQFALENVAMGITAAGKTRAVADYCYKIQYYLSTGSLYAGVEELAERISLNDAPAELAPFVTQVRLTTYLNKLKTYLHIS
jgi:hypothetical protein